MPEDEAVVEDRIRKKGDDGDVERDLRLLGGAQGGHHRLADGDQQEVDRRDPDVAGAGLDDQSIVGEEAQHPVGRESRGAEKQQARPATDRPGDTQDLADVGQVAGAPELAVEGAAARAESEDHHPVHGEDLGGEPGAGERQFAQPSHHNIVYQRKRAGDQILQRDGHGDGQKRPIELSVIDVNAAFHKDYYIKWRHHFELLGTVLFSSS